MCCVDRLNAQGKVVRSAEALAVSFYRVMPKNGREFVDGLRPGMYCHHVFYLIELYADGKAVVSDQFGACKELRGAKFQGQVPLILLSDPYVPGRSRSRASTNFAWKNGSIVQVSGEMPATSPSECVVIHEATSVGNRPFDPGHQTKVSGKGRLQFSSGPVPGCERTGVFVNWNMHQPCMSPTNCFYETACCQGCNRCVK